MKHFMNAMGEATNQSTTDDDTNPSTAGLQLHQHSDYFSPLSDWVAEDRHPACPDHCHYYPHPHQTKTAD